MNDSTRDDEIFESLAGLPDPPLSDLLERRVLVRARAEIARSSEAAPLGRLARLLRVLEPAVAVGLAAGHLIWVVDAVLAVYR
jgi:hypothetical protein